MSLAAVLAASGTIARSEPASWQHALWRVAMRLATLLSPWNPLCPTHPERLGSCAPWSGLGTSSEAGVLEERLTHCVPSRANELKVVAAHAPPGACAAYLGQSNCFSLRPVPPVLLGPILLCPTVLSTKASPFLGLSYLGQVDQTQSY